MAKLQVLSGSLAGQSFELKEGKTTVGRVEDNAILIAEPSVSSHHAEIHVVEQDVIIKDLGSTNGSFINGEKITESVLKAGQVLRLGQVELRLDDGTPLPPPSATASASTPAPAPGPAAGAKRQDQTMAVQRGVSLDQLAEPRSSGFDTATSGFTKKTNKVNRYFLIGGIILGVIILIGLAIALKSIKSP
ncbi:MAG TPA: FHA domain-containing protein [Verrucomicrobiae bacterium]|nr:FHA domain-containing protein [Verrucomicrobiae bacterium]